LFRSKVLAALVVCLSFAFASQARADLSLTERDFGNGVSAAAATAGFLQVWEQADLIEQLLRAGKSPEAAKELLDSMQTQLDALQQRIGLLSRTAATRLPRDPEIVPIRPASW
jgi:hypothetical protein